MERREPRAVPDPLAIVTGYQQAVDRFLAQTIGANFAAIIGHEARLLDALAFPGKFPLGQTVATPGALSAMEQAQHIPPEFLLLHKHGQWGELDPDDIRENERSLREGSRLFSAYHTRLGEKVWCITEWDRSATTLLLPEEY